MRHVLKCTLEEFYNGKTVKLKIQRAIACTVCNGLGIVQRQVALPQGVRQDVVTCSTCEGKKTVRTPNELEYEMKPGIRNGFRKRLKAQGDSPSGMIPSDIYLIVEQKPHDIYTRCGPVCTGFKTKKRFY